MEETVDDEGANESGIGKICMNTGKKGSIENAWCGRCKEGVNIRT